MSAQDQTAPLYRRVLGQNFERLPSKVRALHDLDGVSLWSGRADVERGTSFFCRLIAGLAGLPPDGLDQPLTVVFTAKSGAETWHRTFGPAVFLSHQSQGGPCIHERVGPARLTLVPEVTSAGLHLSLAAVHVLGIPVPKLFLPVVSTREYEVAGRYHFEVVSDLKVFGRLVRYSGWLEPEV